METIFSDEYFMRYALKEAVIAQEENEIPIGAIVVCKNQIISKAHNQTEALNDATAHAEMLAITSATNTIGNKFLNDCTIFVTIEPCVMCAGALLNSRIGRLVFGAYESKTGYSCFSPSILHKKTTVTGGVLENECKKLMTDFFSKLRN